MKYKSEFDRITNNNILLTKCSEKSCGKFYKESNTKIKDFIKNVIKNAVDFNIKKEKKIAELMLKKNSHPTHITYVNADDLKKKKLHTGYVKFEKKFINDVMKINKNETRDFLAKSQKILEDFAYSKEITNLRECNFRLCSEILRKGLNLLKDLYKKICEETKSKKYCKLHELTKGIDFDKITPSDYIKYYIKSFKIQ